MNDPVFEHFPLAHGTDVYYAVNPHLDAEHIAFLSDWGSHTDLANERGLSHLSEHMLANTIPGMGSCADVEGYFERRGGEADWETGYAYFAFRTKIPPTLPMRHKAIETAVDMVCNSELTEQTNRIEKLFETERNAVLNEHALTYPHSGLYELMQERHRQLFAGHKLSCYTCPIGDHSMIKQIDLSRMRGRYESFRDHAHYIVVAYLKGQPQEFLEMVEQSRFNQYRLYHKKVKREPLSSLLIEPATPTMSVLKLKSDFHGFGSDRQTRYATYFRLPGNTKEMIVRLLLQMISILIDEELHEEGEGQIYSPDASFNFLLHAYELEIEVDIGSPRRRDIPDIMEKIFERVGKSEELFRARRRALVNGLKHQEQTGADTVEEMVQQLGETGSVKMLKQTISSVERLKFSDITALLPHLKPEHRFTVIKPPKH